ncbi:MAG: hypothetical protein BAJALOKI3v1_270020 [Promethearchaeota archaeon]|nr:MAG: hypothetical protein BAJALOKI3v1_270020 [Candidatus Lokiarchaeota archaeon]
MSKFNLGALIKNCVGKELFKKAKEFPTNMINIISLKKDPLFARMIVFDEEREFHIIIDEENKEIFHDCPSFLIYSDRDKKICKHFLKSLFLLNEEKAVEIFKTLESYTLTSEDFGSKKKSENFTLLANRCFNELDNYVDGLNYLNKAIINQSQCGSIIENFLNISLKKGLFIEFFEFIRKGYRNELGSTLEIYKKTIQRGFEQFLNSISQYSFYNLLRIINYIEDIFKYISVDFLANHFSIFKKMLLSQDWNEQYFAIYIIRRHYNSLVKAEPRFTDAISEDKTNDFREQLVDYFLQEIENFSVLEKLELMKEQFSIFNIDEDRFLSEYENYKKEIKELEKKVYLKKFVFLKFLMEKYNVKRTKVDFRKKRNVYEVSHNEENLNNPAYSYILGKIGFFGINDSTIKSSDIGINYFIIKDLFLDNFNNFQDIFYYKKQFWGDEEYEINVRDAGSLLTKDKDYVYNVEEHYSNDKVMIVEWDLASKPIKGSLVNAYSSQILIPDQNNPLFHDLRPFDLCYCMKTPTKIEGDMIKNINIITKCSFKDAVKNIANGMEYVEGYYPLSLVKSVIKKELDPFEANRIASTNPNRQFTPNYKKFIKEFRKFLFKFINKERSYIFNEIKRNPKNKSDQILILLNLYNDLAGMDLPYSEFIEDILENDMNIDEFKQALIKSVHKYIQKLLKKREIGSTIAFRLKEMKNSPFIKYFDDFIEIRKKEFENQNILKSGNKCDISQIKKTYYGIKFAKILNLGESTIISPRELSNFKELSQKLGLKLNIVEVESIETD